VCGHSFLLPILTLTILPDNVKTSYNSICQGAAVPYLVKVSQKDFFDLIIVDECHRGSARDETNWREILEYFEPAYQRG
jgi:type I restriction enzyme R subunit